MINSNKVVKDYNKLKIIAKRYEQKKKYEYALRCIKLAGNLMYNLNFFYYDDDLEQMVTDIGARLIDVSQGKQEKVKEKILFYDGFGLDQRGLAQIYIKALVTIGLPIVYVIPQKQYNEIPEIKKILLQNNDNKIETVNEDSIIQGISSLQKIISENNITVSFLYTSPFDMIGITVFNAYRNHMKRFLINLTDHAFWIGKRSFDYIIEFRDYGASISVNERNISKNLILKQPYYPVINTGFKFEGFPFDETNKKIIFSGGALYKTYGDNNKYYCIVEHLLKKDKDVIFLYAGFGDGTELKKLQKKYKNRIFWINERKDLYEVMKRCYFYLSTYPMIGGLMTQYAVAAGVVPMTLIYDECSTGVLLNPEEIGIEYKNFSAFIAELDKMLEDRNVVFEKEQKLKRQIITEDEFNNNLKKIVFDNSSNYIFKCHKVETERFRHTYIERMTKEMYYKIFIKKWALFICKYFPKETIGAIRVKIKEEIKKEV